MAYAIIAASILLRFAPHPADFSPVYAALLLSGAVVRKAHSILFPLSVIMVSDLLLTPLVYRAPLGRGQAITWMAFAATALCGWLLRERLGLWRVAGVVLAGPTVFFLIANFGVWATSGIYPHSFSGLTLCYLAALPFYGHAVASTCICGALISALYFGWVKVSSMSAFRPQPR